MRLGLYPDEAAFASVIDAWTARAAKGGAQLVVFPENVGLPLMTLGLGLSSSSSPREVSPTEPSKASTAPSAAAIGPEQIKLRLLLRHGTAASALAKRYGLRIDEALTIHLARQAESAYRRIFTQAARRHKVMIAAGSCPIVRYRGSRPEVRNGGVIIDASGRPLATTLKVNPIGMEKRLLGIRPSPDHTPPVVQTEFARVGVAICWDCHFPKVIAEMARQGMEILIDPRANPGSWTPKQAAVSHDTGLWKRVQEHDCYGIECFAVGTLLGILFEGPTQIVGPTELTPDGSGVIAHARSHDQEELVMADLDMAALRLFRQGRNDR